jgi:hypothetical protein
MSDIDCQLKFGHDNEKRAPMPAVEEHFKADPYSVNSLVALSDDGYDPDHMAYSNRACSIGSIQ